MEERPVEDKDLGRENEAEREAARNLDAFIRNSSFSRRQLLRLTGATVGVAALSPILAACGQSRGPGASAGGTPAAVESLAAPAAKVNLEFWNQFSGPDGDFMAKLVDKFNAETPNVQVKATRIPGDQYINKYRTGAAANKLPQVGTMWEDQIAGLAADGILTPIDDLTNLLKLDASDFTESSWKTGEYQGKRYGVPLDVHPYVFFWNKTLFEGAGLDPNKAPASKEEFEAAAKKLTSGGNYGYIVDQANAFLAGILFSTLFYQGGGQWTNADGSQATYNSDAAVNASNWLKSIVDNGWSPKGVASDVEINQFKAGKNAMLGAGIWETTANAKAFGDKLGAASFPSIFGKGAWGGTHHFIAPKGLTGDQRQGAYYFINYIVNHAVDWGAAGQIPASKAVRDSSEFKNGTADALPYVRLFEPGINDVQFLPMYPGIGDAMTGAGAAWEANIAVITGKKEAKAAFDEAAARSTKVLQANKKKYGY
jgi:multiple sugar transport system substrate-binding protein